MRPSISARHRRSTPLRSPFRHRRKTSPCELPVARSRPAADLSGYNPGAVREQLSRDAGDGLQPVPAATFGARSAAFPPRRSASPSAPRRSSPGGGTAQRAPAAPGHGAAAYGRAARRSASRRLGSRRLGSPAGRPPRAAGRSRDAARSRRLRGSAERLDDGPRPVGPAGPGGQSARRAQGGPGGPAAARPPPPPPGRGRSGPDGPPGGQQRLWCPARPGPGRSDRPLGASGPEVSLARARRASRGRRVRSARLGPAAYPGAQGTALARGRGTVGARGRPGVRRVGRARRARRCGWKRSWPGSRGCRRTLRRRLLQGSALPIDFLLHDEVRHALRRGFWDALERSRR